MTKKQWMIIGGGLVGLICVCLSLGVMLSFLPQANGGAPRAEKTVQPPVQAERLSVMELSNFFDQKYGVSEWEVTQSGVRVGRTPDGSIELRIHQDPPSLVQLAVSYKLNEDDTGDRLVLDTFRQLMDADSAAAAKKWFNAGVRSEASETTIADFKIELLNQSGGQSILLSIHLPSGA